MKTSRHFACVVMVLLVSGCGGNFWGGTFGSSGSSVRYVEKQVVGDGFSVFFYVRQDIYAQLGSNDQEQIEVVNESQDFGPNPNRRRIRVRVGQNYYFFPVCGDEAEAQHRKLIGISETDGQIVLRCNNE